MKARVESWNHLLRVRHARIGRWIAWAHLVRIHELRVLDVRRVVSWLRVHWHHVDILHHRCLLAWRDLVALGTLLLLRVEVLLMHGHVLCVGRMPVLLVSLLVLVDGLLVLGLRRRSGRGLVRGGFARG